MSGPRFEDSNRLTVNWRIDLVESDGKIVWIRPDFGVKKMVGGLHPKFFYKGTRKRVDQDLRIQID